MKFKQNVRSRSSFCTHSPAPNLHITPSISGTLHEEPRFVARSEYMQPKMPRQRLLHLKPACQQTLRNTEPVNKPLVNQVNEPRSQHPRSRFKIQRKARSEVRHMSGPIRSDSGCPVLKASRDGIISLRHSHMSHMLSDESILQT